jgi:hypothetical protein
MNRLILQSTSLAQWYALVTEAEELVGKQLSIDLESYLVHLLERYTNKPDLIASILALEYLNSFETSGRLRAVKLRDVGDKCLLFSGFFPELANKRHVTVSYFVGLGKCAYSYLSIIHNAGLLTSELYALLKEHYVCLIDLLLSIRDLAGEKQVLSLIQAEDLWRNAGSLYAFNVLKKHNSKVITTNNLPLDKSH